MVQTIQSIIQLRRPKMRCEWSKRESMHDYHDKEWGVPVHNDRKLFEFLILEGAQAGLTWETILKRRKGYKRVFANFDYNKVAKFTIKDKAKALKDEGIIRNRLKVDATVLNAQKFLEVRKEFGTFNKYIWSFVKGKVKKNKVKSLKDIPVTTKESDAMSKDLKKRGFKFCGSTICYAYMQAVGMVNDHETSCFRYKEV